MWEKAYSNVGRRSLGLSGAAALAALIALNPMPVAAQSIFDLFAPPPPSTEDVHRNLERNGFQVKSAIVRRGDVYLADVVTRNGDAQRLVINARTGQPIEGFPERYVASQRRADLAPRNGSVERFMIDPRTGLPVEALPERNVVTRNVDGERFVIDPRTGRLLEVSHERPLASDPQRVDSSWGSAPRPEAEVPNRFPLFGNDDDTVTAPKPYPHTSSDHLAMGGGGPPATQFLSPPPDTQPTPPEGKPAERARPKIARPRPTAPAPTPSVSSAAVEPGATPSAEPSPNSAVTPPPAAASTPNAAPRSAAVEAQPTPAAGPAPQAQANSVAAASAPPAKPAPQPTPTAKTKSINDIPVTPLD